MRFKRRSSYRSRAGRMRGRVRRRYSTQPRRKTRAPLRIGYRM